MIFLSHTGPFKLKCKGLQPSQVGESSKLEIKKERKKSVHPRTPPYQFSASVCHILPARDLNRERREKILQTPHMPV